MPAQNSRYDVVVIGSGFGGAMTALSLAHHFKKSGRTDSILVMERGTWWTTPVSTAADPEVRTASFLAQENKQPVQYWSSVDHFRGLVDILLRCQRRKGNEDGLFELTSFGTSGFLGFGRKSDGVSILRACGVGGGSLVYANVTIRPPEVVFDDERWAWWTKTARDRDFQLARDAIGFGVIWARKKAEGADEAGLKGENVNPGLSNIVTRTMLLAPHFVETQDPDDPNHKLRRLDIIDPQQPKRPDRERNWIDRARVFQSAMMQITADFGTVDSSIANIDDPAKLKEPIPNYCERQGRCIIGCLPGARHTLNKQLMRAAFGTPTKSHPPDYEHLEIAALAEVEVIEKLGDNHYRVHYRQRRQDNASRFDRRTVEAKRVVVAAGCVGTNEILLRSRERGTLKDLSPRLGHGFSTNGDYLGFVEGTKKRVNLTRGPVTTSFGHFNTPHAALPGEAFDPTQFHTIEDNGIPRPLATVVGAGLPLLRRLANGNRPRWIIFIAALHYGARYVARGLAAYFSNHRRRSEFFESEDEKLANIMCVAGIGRDEARGQFRLGGAGETTLRVARDDGKPFHEDPIYRSMKVSLDRFAVALTGRADATFVSPFLNDAADALKAKAVTLSHPLGGCPISTTPEKGVVDPHGRVFDTSRSGTDAVHRGLYVADGAVVPSSLGVNPSLTIAALALRCADMITDELD